MENSRSSKIYQIYYPLNKLKESPLYTSPTNTDTIWEYYLLENLSCGLVRDDQFSGIGYKGCLVNSWQQVNPFVWKFELKKDLKLSDGTQLTPVEIYDYFFNFFKSKKSRHLKLLNKMKNFELTGDELIFTFNEPTDRSVLHELSLADSVFVPSSDEKNLVWSRTVGPYYIDYNQSNAQSIILKANRFSPFFDSNMPQTVELFQFTDSSKANLFFTKKYPTDFYLFTPQANRKLLKELITNGAVHESFAKTNVFYFYFPKDSIAIKNNELRHAFSRSVHTAKQAARWVDDGSLDLWEQMIPPGFPGLCDLESIKVTSIPAQKNVPVDELVIWLRIAIENLSEDFLQLLEANLIQSGITKKVTYSIEKPNSSFFAAITGFVGNQQDPLGSWSYLIDAEHAPLGAFKQLYVDEFQSNNKDRIAISKDIQCKVLSNNHAIPVLLGSFHALYSKRLDISRLNRFDNRIRIYEMRVN